MKIKLFIIPSGVMVLLCRRQISHCLKWGMVSK